MVTKLPEDNIFVISQTLLLFSIGDSLTYHNGMRFSAKDMDLDTSTYNCAQRYIGGWWYIQCLRANLNSLYLRGYHDMYRKGITWRSFRGDYYSLKTTVMKIRPMHF